MPDFADELAVFDPIFNVRRSGPKHDDAPPPRKPKHKAAAAQERKRRKHQATPRRGFDPRSVRAALQGMLLGFDRLARVLDGPALALARSAFTVGGDYPATARAILGWPEPVEVAVDRTIKPPWED